MCLAPQSVLIVRSTCTSARMDIKAGRIVLSADTMRADPRKGLLRMSPATGGCRVQWLERVQPSAAPELDVLIAPSEAAFVKLERPGARILALEYAGAPQKNAYFWLQEPKPEEDGARVIAANGALTQVAATPAAQPHGASASSTASIQAQAPGIQPAAAGPTRGIQAAQLSAILSGMGIPPPQPAAQATAAVDASALTAALQATMRAGPAAPTGPALEDVLTPDALLPLLQHPDMLSRLAPHMPAEHRSPEQLHSLLRSPQFRRQMHAFHSAFSSGQLDMRLFGLNPQGYSVADFLNSFLTKPEG